MSRIRDLHRLLYGLRGTTTLLQNAVDLITSYGLSLTDQSERFGAGLDGGPSLVLLPDDTAGQMNFTRNSAALTRHPLGFLVSIPVNGLRFDYRRSGPGWVPAGFLIETGRTNLIQRSSAFNLAPWTGAAVITAGSTTGPDQQAGTGSTINDNTAASLDRSQVFSVPANSSFETGIALKRTTGTNAPSIRWNFNNGGNPEIVYDIDNGVSVARSPLPANFTPYVMVEGNGYWRCGMYGTDSTASTRITMSIRPAFASTFTNTIDVSATGSVYAANAEFKVGVGVTSVIQTPAAATAPRGADILTKPLSARLNRIAMTTMFTARLLQGSVGGMLWQYDDGTNANRIYVYVYQNRICLAVEAGAETKAFITGPVMMADTDFSIAFSWSRITGELTLRVNGITYLATASTIPKVSYRRIGCDALGAGQPNAWINPFRTKTGDPSLSATEFLRVLGGAELAAF